MATALGEIHIQVSLSGVCKPLCRPYSVDYLKNVTDIRLQASCVILLKMVLLTMYIIIRQMFLIVPNVTSFFFYQKIV